MSKELNAFRRKKEPGISSPRRHERMQGDDGEEINMVFKKKG